MVFYNNFLSNTGTEFRIDNSHMFKEKHKFIFGEFEAYFFSREIFLNDNTLYNLLNWKLLRDTFKAMCLKFDLILSDLYFL
jgi:hypothetical protein